MALELNKLTQAVKEMGQALARRQEDYGQLVQQAQSWLFEFSGQEDALRDAASKVYAAVPTHESLDTRVSIPSLPDRFTVIGADGTQVQPDRHGLALYYLINIGSLVYRHGSGSTPEARSVPDFRYLDGDLYEERRLVQGNLLDVRRDQAEVAHLAERVEEEAAGQDVVPHPTLALVDGTLLLWVLEDEPARGMRERDAVERYVEHLERIRRRGAAVASFTSRPRRTEVGRLLHLARSGGDVERAKTEPNPWERIPDREIFSFLLPGERSAIFASPARIGRYYTPGHEIHFFYVNVADEEEEPIVARVEVPAWVLGARHQRVPLLDLVHGGVVAQSRIAGGFPYVLVRADELAFISGPERDRLEEMVGTALMTAGLIYDRSPKAMYKQLTRQGRRKPELVEGGW